MMEAHRLNKDSCPKCGKILDAASSPTHDHKPEPGDISVCLGCQTILQFGDDLRLHTLSHEDYEKLSPKTKREVGQIQEMIEWVKAKGG